MKIDLYNRDGATMWLEKIGDIDPHTSKWGLEVDSGHKYCLEYMRTIGYPEIEAIDPSGGPMISLADEFEGKYKVIKIINPTTLLISERNSNN